MSNKYEKLIDLIINEETDKASALFHQIVVEQSRGIYEGLMQDEDTFEAEDVGGNETEDFVDDVRSASDKVDGDEQGFDDEGVDGEDADEVVDGEEAVEDEDMEDRVLDLESAIDELKAEFEQLMAGEKNEEENYPGIHDEEGEADLEGKDDDQYEESMVREYVEKVTRPVNSENEMVGKGGKFSAGNTKSTVACKNDMGGSAANIARGGRGENPDGQSPKKASNYGTKGQGELIGKVENSPGANTKGYSDRAKVVTKEK